MSAFGNVKYSNRLFGSLAKIILASHGSGANLIVFNVSLSGRQFWKQLLYLT